MKKLMKKIPVALLAAAMALAFVSFADYNGGITEPAFAEEGVTYNVGETDEYELPGYRSYPPAISAYIEDGSTSEIPVSKIEVIEQTPLESGDEVVEVVHNTDFDEWSYNLVNPGEAKLKISYERLDGQMDSYILNVYCVKTKYEIQTRTAENKDIGLPGEEFTIVSEPLKTYAEKTSTGEWESLATSDGLTVETWLGEGSEYATLNTDGENPVVKFNDLPEGEDSISACVEVCTKVSDKNATGTLHGTPEYKKELYIYDTYEQIEPRLLPNPDLRVGETETFQPKVRHYSLANPEGVDVDNATFYWTYPEETFSELKCENGVCSIKRIDYWEQSHNLTAEYSYGENEGTLDIDYYLNAVPECTHPNLKEVKAVKATLTKKGNTRYFKCNDCMRYFLDANATETIDKYSWVIPARVMTVKAAKTSFTVKASKLKKASQTIKSPIKVTFKKTSMRTKLTYKISSVSKSKYKKYFTINKTTGKLTIKKKLKKGTYTVKVKVTAASNSKYAAASKIATLKIKVK